MNIVYFRRKKDVLRDIENLKEEIFRQQMAYDNYASGGYMKKNDEAMRNLRRELKRIEEYERYNNDETTDRE